MDRRINGGLLACITPDGGVEWISDRRLEVEGSHSAKIQVRGSGLGDTGSLEISGNPSKFLQGHNVFGTANLPGLTYKMLDRVCKLLELEPSDVDRAMWRLGNFELTRVDITRMYDLGTQDAVRKFLAACIAVAHAKHQRTSARESTVYVGQYSRRVSLKFYDKWSEMQVKGHKMSDTLSSEVQSKLLDFAKGKLRVECKLMSTELRDRDLRIASRWTPEKAEQLLDERLLSLELSDTMILEDAILEHIPVRMIGVYEAWRAGHDIRSRYSKATFYRYRSQLLKYGIDILHVRPREVVEQTQYLLGAPLKSFLDGTGAPIPVWAAGTEFLAG
jgi:II/X family phage/plasmid replication protein